MRKPKSAIPNPLQFYMRRKAHDDLIEAAALVAGLIILRHVWRRNGHRL
jgi:hypothetical protein